MWNIPDRYAESSPQNRAGLREGMAGVPFVRYFAIAGWSAAVGAVIGIFLTTTAYHDPDFHPHPPAQPPREVVVVKTVQPSPVPKRDSAACHQARQLGDRIQFVVTQLGQLKGDTQAAVHDAHTAIVGRNWKELQNITTLLSTEANKNDPLFIELVDLNLKFRGAVSSCASS